MPQNSFSGCNDGPKLRAKAEAELAPGLLRRLVLLYATREDKLISCALKHPVDLLFLLMLSPEESLRRKPDNDAETIRLKHELLLRTDFAASSVIKINAEQPFNNELQEIKQHIPDTIRRSYIP